MARAKSKIFAIASFFGNMFARVMPQGCSPRFLPCYTFKCVSGDFLQAEPYLEDAHVGLSHVACTDAPDNVASETYKFAAFQHFVYMLSDKSIVFPSCTLVSVFP